MDRRPDRIYRVYLLGVAEGVQYDLSVGEQLIRGVRPDNGVVVLEAAAGSEIRLTTPDVSCRG